MGVEMLKDWFARLIDKFNFMGFYFLFPYFVKANVNELLYFY